MSVWATDRNGRSANTKNISAAIVEKCNCAAYVIYRVPPEHVPVQLQESLLSNLFCLNTLAAKSCRQVTNHWLAELFKELFDSVLDAQICLARHKCRCRQLAGFGYINV